MERHDQSGQSERTAGTGAREPWAVFLRNDICAQAAVVLLDSEPSLFFLFSFGRLVLFCHVHVCPFDRQDLVFGLEIFGGC